MSLITHTGGAESDSFAAVYILEEAIIRVYGSITASGYEDLDEGRLEHCARLAAALFDWLPLDGRRAFRNQRLAFPRTCQEDPRVVPVEVIEAQALIYNDVTVPAVAKGIVSDLGSEISLRAASFGAVSFDFGTPILATGSVLLKALQSSHWQVYARLKKYIVPFRGGTIRTAAERAADEASLLTTTSDEF